MSKKADKRRHKRRQQHHAGGEARSQEARRFVDERVAAATAAVGQLVEAAKDEKLPPAAVAAMVADAVAGDFLVRRILTADEMLVPIAEEVVGDAGSERARAVAAALEQRLDDQLELAWPALALAGQSEDLESAGRIAERALERMAAAGGDGDAGDDAGGDDAGGDDAGGQAARMAAELAAIRWRRGRLGEALEGMEGWCVRRPDHPDLQHMQAVLVTRAAGLRDPDPEVARIFSERVDDDQHDAAAGALARFHDRSLLYRLRDGVEAFIATDPVLSARRDRYIAGFVEDVRESADLGPLDDLDPSLSDLAAERFWLAGDPDDDGDDDTASDDTASDDTADSEQSPLGMFAAHADTPADLAAAARDWLGHVRYGLWLADWYPADRLRGRWMTDIVTRRRVYAAIAPEQLEGVPRWAVLAGAVAPVAGVWRTGQALVAMDPHLADEAAESLLAVSEAVAFEMAREQGIKVPRQRSRARRSPDAHGVLSEVLEPMDRYEAQLTSHVVGNSLSQLVAMVESDRRRVPAMRNTDGEPVELISATFPVADPGLLRRRLIGDMDFEADDDGNGSDVTVRWLGRAMTAEESAGALAQFRAAHPTAKIEDAGGPQRWMRGTVHFEQGQVRAEVNSRARLDAVTAKLRRLGAGEPTVARRIDPAMDLPSSGGRGRLGRSLGAQADAAWAAQWVKEKVPALGGATPAAAARDPRRIALLERLLRQFEHDADVVAASGETPMDLEPLRERLGMQDGILDVYDTD